jgi:hypothetical protein
MKHLKNIQFADKAVKNGLIAGLSKATSKGLTENGAVTFTESGSANLDFFAQAGAMRKNPSAALELFKKAFYEDRQTSVRVLFYLRDIRGGQGERKLFRTCLEWLGEQEQDIFEKIISHVPEYGRWDDIFFDNAACFRFINSQLMVDDNADNPSLLAKWLPTINAKSKNTRQAAMFMAKNLQIDDISYRRWVRDLRKKIATVEEKMSARDWKSIDFSKVPSQASRIYKNAFERHDGERYGKFIEKATKGEVKINASTLYPYQIYDSVNSDYSKTLEALWNQLPDYTQGRNALVVADVSGSMSGTPLSVSVSLALYFAERNKGQFKDYFITFSAQPKLQKVVGKTLKEKMANINNAQWDMNTDLQAVFDTILDTAVANMTSADEMPSTLYIISDMEFDMACGNHTNFEVIEKKYAKAGYKIPTIVFWNVDAKTGKNLPARADQKNVSMVSGFSPSIFKIAVENKTAEQVMVETVNSERYAPIVL